MRTLYRVTRLVIISCIASTGCRPVEYTDVIKEDFIYINHTSLPVQITYHNHQVTIEKNQAIRQTGYSNQANPDHIHEAQQVILTFGQDKQLTYQYPNSYTPTNQNILDMAQTACVDAYEIFHRMSPPRKYSTEAESFSRKAA